MSRRSQLEALTILRHQPQGWRVEKAHPKRCADRLWVVAALGGE